MDTQLKADIEAAITATLVDSGAAWNHLLHPTLVKQMTNAAEAVFDSVQDAQEYYEHEHEHENQ